jgi:hypothetical protein
MRRFDSPSAMPAKTGLVLALAAWIAVIWYAVNDVGRRIPPEQYTLVATWGVAIVAGGVFVLYTWTVVAGIMARERLRASLQRSITIADDALDEFRESNSSTSR